jgi:hypothetical protein
MRAFSLVVLLLGAQAGPGTADFHVAPAGKDDAAGTREAPFATLARARDAARAVAGKKPVRILLRTGVYFQAEPFVLKPEDSGTPAAPVLYAAAPGEKPVVSAGARVTGWKAETVRGLKLWVAELGGTPRQLWVNGARADRPRLPREGYFHIAEIPDMNKNTAWSDGQKRFRFAPGEMKNWQNIQDVEVVALHFWVDSRMPVEAVDEAERMVTLGKRSIFRLTEDHGPKPARYWVENVFEALERPGQWYHDRKAGKIYYYPKPGEDPARAEAIVSRGVHAMKIEGRPEAGKFVEHVRFRGIAFSHGESQSTAMGWPKSDVAGPVQAAVTSPGLVHAAGYRNGAFEDGAFCRTGSYGLELAAGCSKVAVAGNELFDLGAGGIKIGEMQNRQEEPLKTGEMTVTDNRIYDGGRVYPSGVGVWVGHSGKNVFAHNHIHHLYYSGFSVGWSWGYNPTGCFDNLFENNLVHDLGQGVLCDMGGIYTLGVMPGTLIRNNIFHDVYSHTYGGWGIYFDEGTTGAVAENNIAYNTKDGGFHQHYGKENVVRNNVFAFAREGQIGRSRQEKHLSFTFERNIVYWKEGPFFRKGYNDKAGEGYTFRDNLYFNAGGQPVEPGGMPFPKWQELGQDRGTLVADPLFANPDKGDFRLKPGSPAAKIGFKPIDVSKVGPRPRPK